MTDVHPMYQWVHNISPIACSECGSLTIAFTEKGWTCDCIYDMCCHRCWIHAHYVTGEPLPTDDIFPVRIEITAEGEVTATGFDSYVELTGGGGLRCPEPIRHVPQTDSLGFTRIE